MDQAKSLRKIVSLKAAMKKKQLKTDSATKNSSCKLRVISITSGKGGVGKTNIVGNLAIAFSKMNKKVMIFDSDLGLANIDIIFGLKPKFNISHVINGEKSLSEVIVEGPCGISIIPASSGVKDLAQLTEGQKLNLLSEFDAFDNIMDIFLIDTGAGISSNVIYFNLAANECVIVATFEPTSITDAYAMMKIMSVEYGTKCFKLLVNMVKNELEAKSVFSKLSLSADRFLNGVILEYIGYVPDDNMLREAVINRKPVMELFPKAVSSKRFGLLAENLLKSTGYSNSIGNINFFLNRFIKYSSEN